MTDTLQKVKDSPSWAKHVATAVTSITVAWIGAWQTASAMAPAPDARPTYSYSQALQLQQKQLDRIDARVYRIDAEVVHANTLLQALLNGGSLGSH